MRPSRFQKGVDHIASGATSIKVTLEPSPALTIQS